MSMGRTAVRPYAVRPYTTHPNPQRPRLYWRTAVRPYNATVYRATASSSTSTPKPGLLGTGR
jgi:hypothetical protein